jgi:hypothetical protein
MGDGDEEGLASTTRRHDEEVRFTPKRAREAWVGSESHSFIVSASLGGSIFLRGKWGLGSAVGFLRVGGDYSLPGDDGWT